MVRTLVERQVETAGRDDVAASGDTGAIIDALVARRATVIAELLDALVPGYPRRQRLPELEAGAGRAFDAITTSMRDGHRLRPTDLPFVRTAVRDAALRGGSEAEILRAPAVAQRVMWDALTAIAERDAGRRDAIVQLAPVLMDYVEAASEVTHDAYVEVHEGSGSRASVARLELVDALLHGRGPRPGVQRDLARTAGLDERSPVVVIVARPLPATDPVSLPLASHRLARAVGEVRHPVAAIRTGEIVLVRATPPDDASRLVDDLDAASRHLAAEGVHLGVAVSTIHDGIATVPTAYEEACLVLERLGGEPGVLALPAMRALDYLLLRSGDATAWRLLPPAVREFVLDDREEGGQMVATLLAYIHHDLNVKRAAETLFIHPNTAHYRLDRIAGRTGCNLRNLEDLEQLTLAIKLAPSASGTP